MKYAVISVIVLFAMISQLIYSQIPKVISYQGILTGTTSNVKPDGEINFTFRLYDSYTSGNALWSESKKLEVKKGTFSTNLGDRTPFGSNLKFDKPYWLSIQNVIKPGYSAITDGEDAAALIKKLNLGKVNVVAHSYGALGALFLAYHHPELVKSLVLAEPPVISLLNHLSGNNAKKGKMLFRDIQDKMVSPMKDAIISGYEEDANRIFFSYVLRDSLAWQKFIPPPAKADIMANIAELDAIFKMGEFFPEITPSQIRHIQTPVLLLSGSKTFQFLPYISERLHELLPNNKLIILNGASHIMWVEQPEECRKAVLEFFRANP